MTAFTILLVMNEAEQNAFAEILAPRGVNLLRAADCAAARELLAFYPDIRVIVTALSLPDGNWWSLHKALMEHGRHAKLIVCLPDANDCASPILAHGAFGVVTQPFKAEEFLALMSAAAGHPLRGRTEAPSAAARMIG